MIVLIQINHKLIHKLNHKFMIKKITMTKVNLINYSVQALKYLAKKKIIMI